MFRKKLDAPQMDGNVVRLTVEMVAIFEKQENQRTADEQHIVDRFISIIDKDRDKLHSQLFEYFNIAPEDENAWKKLALELAFRHVPAFRWNAPEEVGGRKSFWTTDRLSRLAIDVNKIMQRDGCSVKTACNFIASHREEYTLWLPPNYHPDRLHALSALLEKRVFEGRKQGLYRLFKDFGLFDTMATMSLQKISQSIGKSHGEG